LEDELWDLTCVVRNKRDRRIALRRFGWDGKEPASLRVTGDSFGVSYEYVRVISNRIVQFFNGKSVFAPALDRVLEFTANHAEQSENLGENELLSTGLVRKRFGLMSLISAAARRIFDSATTAELQRLLLAPILPSLTKLHRHLRPPDLSKVERSCLI
jgi:hypothetical protein